MGNATVIVLNNDYAGEVEMNPEEFARSIRVAMCSGLGGDIIVGRRTVGKALPSRSRDEVQVVASAGGVSELVFSELLKVNPLIEEDQTEILKAWARRLGFDLVERKGSFRA